MSRSTKLSLRDKDPATFSVYCLVTGIRLRLGVEHFIVNNKEFWSKQILTPYTRTQMSCQSFYKAQSNEIPRAQSSLTYTTSVSSKNTIKELIG